jgi:staphylococcal nuclease domain-containing protein 1
MPTDSNAFMSEWKGKELPAVVEQVKDGSTIRARLLLPDGDHQVVNLALAGVRASRATVKAGETGESFGEEVRTLLSSLGVWPPGLHVRIYRASSSPSPASSSAR